MLTDRWSVLDGVGGKRVAPSPADVVWLSSRLVLLAEFHYLKASASRRSSLLENKSSFLTTKCRKKKVLKKERERNMNGPKKDLKGA